MKTTVKLQIKAQEANPSPPIGPALGSKGVNIMNFCNKFNDATKNMPEIKKGTLVSVIIHIYPDKSFDFIIKSTPTSNIIKDILNIGKGSKNPNKTKISKITREQLEIIVKQKSNDLIVNSNDAAIKTISGTAKSMGIEIE
ncbi:MAG TPA: 50S ribosomal protein L11 [Candidatus Azoamicus sp.]